MRSIAFCVLLLLAPLARAVEGPQEPVMARAHSHNDYEQQRPLQEALENKFGSVEADIYLVDGELLVAHNRADCKPERTLEAMYLAPLEARVKQNDGHVYPGGGDILLLIDIKSDGAEIYPVLKKQLQKHADIFTEFSDTEIKRRPVTAILSGNRPIELVKAEPTRLCGIDGRLADLAAGAPANLMPMISESWAPTFKWYGNEAMPEDQLQRLKDLVAKAHAGKQLLRFWGLPTKPDVVWPVLFDAGVDLLNADDLPRLRAFLLSRAK